MSHLQGRLAATVEAVEKEQAIWERLERIDGLREDDAPAGILLAEVRALLAEAEEWMREEADAPRRAAVALDRSKAVLAAGEQQPVKLLLGR